MERISILLLLSCSLVAAIHAGDLVTCARNYKRVGCFTDKSDQSKSMLVYDRYAIQWKDIVAYMHNLACRCEKEARKYKKYAGFAIHFWGECYGKTQAQLDAVVGKRESLECTGDQSYNGCASDAKECAGHAYTDFVYKLQSIGNVTLEAEDCNDQGFDVQCASGTVLVTGASFAARTPAKCGAPLTINWDPRCGIINSNTVSSLTQRCLNKAICNIRGWKQLKSDPCPKKEKYFKIEYKCE